LNLTIVLETQLQSLLENEDLAQNFASSLGT
jgi:hypothetical protein